MISADRLQNWSYAVKIGRYPRAQPEGHGGQGLLSDNRPSDPPRPDFRPVAVAQNKQPVKDPYTPNKGHGLGPGVMLRLDVLSEMGRGSRRTARRSIQVPENRDEDRIGHL